jgi:hypothetical protein
MTETPITVGRGTTASFAKFAEDVEADLRLSQYRSLFVAELEPKYMEFARMRRLYGANTGAGTAIAPVAALPTTTAAWALYNPTTNTRVLIPLRAYCYSVSGTMALGMAMVLAGLTSPVASAPSAYTDSVNKAIMPNSQASNAVFGQNVTVVAPVWNVHAARSQVSAIEVGSGLSADLHGLYVIEPGYALCGSILSAVSADDLYGFGFVWGELDLTLA